MAARIQARQGALKYVPVASVTGLPSERVYQVPTSRRARPDVLQLGGQFAAGAFELVVLL
jgi:hypothetical protein